MKTVWTFLFLILCVSTTVSAQTQVTFNLDMRSHMRDSLFIPGRDVAELSGSFFPINNRPVLLRDTSPIDSIFTAEVTFPERYNNLTLEYNFSMIIAGRRQTEDTPRLIPLKGRPVTLPLVMFNAFAW